MSDSTITERAHLYSDRAVAEFLVVDLDGTLLQTDLLWESLLSLLGARPWFLFLIPIWLLRGKAALKREIARRTNLDVSTLPFRTEVIAFLRAEKAKGRKLILATGADLDLCLRVSEFLGLFDLVLASDGKTNLTGKHKARKIEEVLATGHFDYIGDSNADLPLWERAQTAIVVAPSRSLLNKLKKDRAAYEVIGERKPVWRSLIRVLRPLHWAKNLLVFVPLLMAHELSDTVKIGQAITAFLSFSLCASGVYVLNDMFDLEADRIHPIKRARPFAAGDLPLWAGFLLFPVLVAAGLGLATVSSMLFLCTIAVYVATTIAYSLYAKKAPIVDVLLLTGLYLLRLLGGGVSTAVPVSPWLLAFSMFVLMSQAFAKRQAELLAASADETRRALPSKRNYIAADLGLVQQFGVTSGYMSVLILALYINGHEVTSLYRHPQVIWLACPLLLFWISRMWLITNRGKMNEDPVVFATRDPVSWGLGLVMLLILFVAS